MRHIELEELDNSYSIRFQLCCARKRAGANLPAPQISPANSEVYPSDMKDCLFHIYKDAGDAHNAYIERQDLLQCMPTSAVDRGHGTLDN